MHPSATTRSSTRTPSARRSASARYRVRTALARVSTVKNAATNAHAQHRDTHDANKPNRLLNKQIF